MKAENDRDGLENLAFWVISAAILHFISVDLFFFNKDIECASVNIFISHLD